MRFFMTPVIVLILMTSSVPAQDLATLSLITSEEHGAYLVGPDGRPVYVLLSTSSVGGDGLNPLESCKQSCRDEWPPLASVEEANIGEGVNPDLIGTTVSGGEEVLTYADQPLFQFYRDVAGTNPKGQGIYGFGGYWALLAASGRPIRSGTMPAADEIPTPPTATDDYNSQKVPPVLSR